MFHPNGMTVVPSHFKADIMTVSYDGARSLMVFLSTVYADGSICLDILQNRWSPTYDVSSILTSIQVRSVNTIHPNNITPNYSRLLLKLGTLS